MARQIVKVISINASKEDVFNALISPSMIKKWWFANSAIVLPETGGTYTVSWGENEDNPDYITICKILEIQAPKKLKLEYEHYFSKFGEMPFEAEFEVVFELEGISNQTNLKVTQTGFPDNSIADPYLDGCVKGWNDTCASLKNTIEN